MYFFYLVAVNTYNMFSHSAKDMSDTLNKATLIKQRVVFTKHPLCDPRINLSALRGMPRSRNLWLERFIAGTRFDIYV